MGDPKDLVAGYWIIQAGSVAEAREWARRIPLEAGGVDAEVEVRPLYELDDFPQAEDESGWREQEAAYREAGPTVNPVQPGLEQYVVFRMADAETESEASPAPSEELLAEMGAYNEEMIRAGAMLTGEGIKPSAEGFRVVYANGKLSVVDGPFPAAQRAGCRIYPHAGTLQRRSHRVAQAMAGQRCGRRGRVAAAPGLHHRRLQPEPRGPRG